MLEMYLRKRKTLKSGRKRLKK